VIGLQEVHIFSHVKTLNVKEEVSDLNNLTKNKGRLARRLAKINQDIDTWPDWEKRLIDWRQ
jgi:hypothetical protein